MKKIILLVLTILMMVGCDYNSNRNIDTKTEGVIYGTIIIDSCEYIRGPHKLAHKGNCRFCKERNLDYKKGKYTVNEFIELTLHTYGGEIIKKLRDSM